MKQALTCLNDLKTLPFDQLIDVRAPAEYAQDHIPGAISLPVLSDAERAEVGTIYVQQDPFLARKIGAALVARNAATHLQGVLADRPGAWRPLVYCWRGGQRSGSFASILAQIGWRVGLVEGGYKSYRRLVVRALYETPVAPRLILLEGGTGTAKTAVLQHLQGQGQQVLDLEAMAQHRGSVLGGRPGGQPAQKMFESRIAMALAGMDAARPVFLEAESNKIGARIIPPMLWQAMLRAEHVRIQAPLRARADYLVENYSDLLADPALLIEKLEALAQFHGHAQVQAWQAMARAAQFQPLAEALIRQHYDPGYRRASRRAGAPRMVVELPGLSPQDLAQAAARIAGAVSPADSGSRPGL
ncbi:tRNA 2-selenouridine(34) synthase MnmH [Thalassobius sp. S69A]|uniref:tRNA 2-selenouridine(34) synthase MnmH n=1 Tax=unclassified Thalassovita TaxID=2619711 RepID=UPI000C100265|nr:tRNA 2-selenouridine(34) synthase MnmH [Paracoccaceae bacterium]